MTQTMAAKAADFEFPADEDIDFDALIAEAEAPDPMIARRMLLEIARDAAAIEATADIKSQIVDRYDERIGELQARVNDRRRALAAYVERFGPVKFPDAGGAHLTTQTKGGKIVCTDAIALEDWLEAQKLPIPFKDAPLDVAAAIDMVAHEMHVHAEPDGRLVNHDTGEVVEIPGIEVKPETKSLTVRKP